MSLFVKSCMGLLLSVLAVSVLAQPRPLLEGEQFASISPPLTTQAKPDLIEILDVFWYGCPLCQEFEPMMSTYGSEIRGDLVLRRMPAIWNPLMKLQAQVYYTAVELNIADQAHPAAFAYVQEQQQPLTTMAQAQAFFGTLGVSREMFVAAWQSDTVNTALVQAQADTLAAGIDRLPALLVNGRYKVVRNAHVAELQEIVVTANQLIRTLRDQRRSD